LRALAHLPLHLESVSINNLIQIEGTLLQGNELFDMLEIVRAGKLMTDPFTGRLVQAPGERVGYVMAYRVYEKFSHGLILECLQPAQVYDYVRRPGA